MSFTSETVVSEQLGAVGLIEKIDSRIELSETKGGIVSHGRRVAAMILNGLSFMNSRLYMTLHFFEDKLV